MIDLIETRVLPNHGVGQVQITGNSSVGYHPNAGIKASHPSSMSRMRWDEVQTTLFSPLMFHIGMSGDYGVGLVVHVGKVRDDEKIGTTEERQDGVRFRIQVGC